MSAFWQNHKCKLIPNWTRKTVWLLNNNINVKKSLIGIAGRSFLKPFFSHSGKLFFTVSEQNFRHHFTWHHRLRKFLRIQNCDVKICTGVTLFALLLHLKCTALSQSESSNFFMYINSYINYQAALVKEILIHVSYHNRRVRCTWCTLFFTTMVIF